MASDEVRQLPCEGCGRYHGSVTVLINCLSVEVIRKGQKILKLEHEIDRLSGVLELIRKALA